MNTLQKITSNFSLTMLVFCFCFSWTQAQENAAAPTDKFWDNVSFGGGIGGSLGSGYSNLYIAPSAIYNFNKKLSVGPALQYSYQSGNGFSSSLYGASIITLVNPIEAVQFSAEIEQVLVNQKQDFNTTSLANSFWNTALFLGAGYRAANVTVGFRYNVLYQKQDAIYASPWIPFVRIFI
ncbi:hypothetical protein N9766_06230 [Flavobacteriaceae bacterium]|nr:hypothetical protein [Flavobacteriaceae bacterium]